MNIIRGELKHIKLIAPLFDAYRIFYGQSTNIKAAEDFITDRLTHNQSIIFVACNDDATEVYGFVQLYPCFSSISIREIFILNDLYVNPEHRQKGIARALLTTINEFARANKVTKVTLQTAHTNTKAQSLYESLGYQKEQNFLTYYLELSKLN